MAAKSINIFDNNMFNKKINFLTISVGLFSLLVLCYLILFKDNSNTESIQTYNTPSILPTTIEPTNSSIVTEQSYIIFSNKYFGDLSFEYPDYAKVTYIQFIEPGETAVVNTCESDCVGINIKLKDTNLALTFTEASDNNLLRCSNKAIVNDISENWTKLIVDTNILYVNPERLKKNYTITDNEEIAYGFGTIEENWSAVGHVSYGICLYGEGIKVNNSTLLLNYPTITNYNTEIDRLIKSISVIDQ